MFSFNFKIQLLVLATINCNTLFVHTESLVEGSTLRQYLSSGVGQNLCCDCIFDDHVYQLFCSARTGLSTFDLVNGSTSFETYFASNDSSKEDLIKNSTTISWICCATNSVNSSSNSEIILDSGFRCLGEVPKSVAELGVSKVTSNSTLCPYRDTKHDRSLNEICKPPDHLKEVDTTLQILLICSISLITITILTYLNTPSLLNIHGKCIVSHLVFLNLFFGLQLAELHVKPGEIINTTDRTRSLCWTLGFLTYFTSISANLWLTAVNVDIFSTFRRKYMEDVEDAKNRFTKYVIIVTTISILLSSIIFGVDQNLSDKDFFSPLIGCTRCFLPLNHGYSILIYYYGLIAILLVLNLVTFGLTNSTICSTLYATKILNPQRGVKNKLKRIMPSLLLFFKLFCVTGTAWTVGLALWLVSDYDVPLEEKHSAARFFECFNVSHGFCYFLVFVCKPSRFMRFWQKYGTKKIHTESTVTESRIEA